MSRVASSLRLISSRRKAEDTTIRSDLGRFESTDTSSNRNGKNRIADEESKQLQDESCYSIKSAPRVSAQPKLLKVLFSNRPVIAQTSKSNERGPSRAKLLLAKPAIPLGIDAAKQDRSTLTAESFQGLERLATRSSKFQPPEHQGSTQPQPLELQVLHPSSDSAGPKSPTGTRVPRCTVPDKLGSFRDPRDLSKLMNIELATPITLSRKEMNSFISQRKICGKAILKKPAGVYNREVDESPSVVSLCENKKHTNETEKTTSGSKKVSFSRNKMIRIFQRQSLIPSLENI